MKNQPPALPEPLKKGHPSRRRIFRKPEPSAGLFFALLCFLLALSLPVLSFAFPVGSALMDFLVWDAPLPKEPFPFDAMNGLFGSLLGPMSTHPFWVLGTSAVLALVGMILLGVGDGGRRLFATVPGLLLVIQAAGWAMWIGVALVGIGAVGVLLFWVVSGILGIFRRTARCRKDEANPVPEPEGRVIKTSTAGNVTFSIKPVSGK